jgi:hypothetical protein
MKKNIRTVIKIFLIIIIFCLPFLAMAQPSGPGCDPGIDPTCVPIDGGLIFLILAALAYGIKKIRDERKGPNTTNE